MRVLWISPNGGNYNNEKIKGTGGWIGALQDALIKYYSDLEIGIVFGSDQSECTTEGQFSYFPIKVKEDNKIKKIWSLIFKKEEDLEKLYIANVKRIIDEFKPDVVHVWGIENTYSAVIPFINCPFVVHIQGLLSLSLYIYMPPAVSLHDISRIESCLNPKTWIKKMLHLTQKDVYDYTCYRATRELRVSKYIKNWIGRTDWDHKASEMLAPGSRYYHCDEMMRGDFNEIKWKYHFDGKKIVIHSSLSSEWYKGIDVILKTAAILDKLKINIEWNVFGIALNDEKVSFFSKLLDIKPSKVKVFFRGRVDGGAIRDSLSRCDVFVHPSYIENSSNAIAEAMIMGVPTVAQYVGGTPSMLRNNSGLLVPSNEPYMMAEAILRLRNRDVAEEFSIRAMMLAKDRQSSQKILKDLIMIYESVAYNN